jgi:hypothetical protein
MATTPTLVQRCASLVQRGWARAGALLTQLHPDPPVDVDDPIGGALQDAELLIAFAAQSRRSVAHDKVLALTTAAARVAELRTMRARLTAADSAAFWAAYDAFAVDIAPLSAHSIRASVRVNRKRFPLSLLTPTAVNAALAVLVFYVCLSLQGFWVAGKEMIERAEALDRQKAELAQKLTRNGGEQARLQIRLSAKQRELCAAGGCPSPAQDGRAQARPPFESAGTAALAAEYKLLRADLAERQQLDNELADERSALGRRSLPLEELMSQWHGRARAVCSRALLGRQPLTFLCPVDGLAEARERQTLRQRIQVLRDKLDKRAEARGDAQDGPATADFSRAAFGPAGAPASWRPGAFVMTDWTDVLKRQLEQELAELDAVHFNRVVVEARMIVANLGTYLIALSMGLLGALTYILRTLSQQLREHTYVPMALSESVVRICLGAIAGVFGSLLLPSGEAGLKSLPPMFTPFVFGYGIEILFSLLDRLVRNFTQPEAGAIGVAPRP